MSAYLGGGRDPKVAEQLKYPDIPTLGSVRGRKGYLGGGRDPKVAEQLNIRIFPPWAVLGGGRDIYGEEGIQRWLN